MSDPVLSGSALTVRNLRRDCYNVIASERVMKMGVSPETMRGLIAKPAFRRAFEMWQEAARQEKNR